MPTTITNLLPEIFELRAREMDASLAGLQDAIQQAGDGLIDMLVDVDPSQWQGMLLTKQVVWLQTQLRGQLNRLGWNDLADKFVSFYDESEIFGRQILRAIGRLDNQLIPLRKDTIQNLRDLDLSAFNEQGNRIITAVSKEVALNTLIGKKRSDMIKDLSATMDGQVEQAQLYVDTAVRVFDRTVNGQLWEEAGINHYKYFGPSDNVTRPFCASHVGKIYTIAEIKQMSNGSARYGDVWRYGGGPRCRHTWTPVVEPEAELARQNDPTAPPESPLPQRSGSTSPQAGRKRRNQSVKGRSNKPEALSVNGLLQSMLEHQQAGG